MRDRPGSLAVGTSVLATRPAASTIRLDWSAVLAATLYNTYRGPLGPGPGFAYAHTCFESGDALGDGPTTSTDATAVAAGTGHYFVVSAENGCGEGTLGTASDGTPRPNLAPCP